MNMWFQIMVVLFTIILIVASWRANQYLDKLDLQNELEISSKGFDSCAEVGKPRVVLSYELCSATGSQILR